MVIGLVLHASHRPRFEEAARTLTGVTFAWAVYEREDQIRERVAGLLRAERLDGLLLGLVPYARSRDLLPPDLPVAVTRSAALDLALAWARARGSGWPATPVSIDTFAQETVDEVATALDLDRQAIACLPFEPEQPITDVVAFHREQLARTGAAYVISVRTGVAAALDGSVAVLHALATPGTIRADLHELALRIRHQRADSLRFAAGVFLIAKPEESADLDRARVGLLHLLLNTPDFADAWIDNRGRRGVVVFAHAALFEAVTHRWVGLPVLAEARDTLGVRAVAGFGLGDSARLCVTLAERAAARAEQDADPGAYLITGHRHDDRPDGRHRRTAGLHLPRARRHRGAGRAGRAEPGDAVAAGRDRAQPGRQAGLPQRAGPLAGHHRPERAAVDPQAERVRPGRRRRQLPGAPQGPARPGSTGWPSPPPLEGPSIRAGDRTTCCSPAGRCLGAGRADLPCGTGPSRRSDAGLDRTGARTGGGRRPGCWSRPGLVDLHTHVGPGYWGIEPDPVAWRSGVTTWVDAGSAGAYTLDGLRRVVGRHATCGCRRCSTSPRSGWPGAPGRAATWPPATPRWRSTPSRRTAT